VVSRACAFRTADHDCSCCRFSRCKLGNNPRGRLSTLTQGPRTHTLTYDSRGFLASLRDPLLRTVQFDYDAAGRVTRQVLPDAREILYAYDANDNLTSITPPGRPAHGFAYTPVDLQETYAPPPAGLPQAATQFTYNLDRQLTSVLRPDGKTIGLTYDAAGRLSTLALARGTSTYGYDPDTGRLRALTAPDGGTMTYAYDGFLLTGITGVE